MNDDARLGKFIRLFGNIFFTFIGFLLVVGLLFIGLKYFFGFLDNFKITESIFTLGIIMIPGLFFIPVFLYYFKRTIRLPKGGAKVFSYLVFVVVIGAWLYSLVTDVYTYFQTHYNEIAKYFSYSILMLGGSIALLFIVGIVQALAAPDEKDWIDVNKNSR